MLLLVALVLPAAAYPPKAGETCEATKTGVSHKIGDKNYKCDSTTCTSFDASGSQIGSKKSARFPRNFFTIDSQG